MTSRTLTIINGGERWYLWVLHAYWPECHSVCVVGGVRVCVCVWTVIVHGFPQEPENFRSLNLPIVLTLSGDTHEGGD